MTTPLPLADVLADAEPLLDDHDPLQAELWASDFLGAFWLQGADDDTTRFAIAEDLLPQAEKLASPEANLLCHALAALGLDAAAESAERLTAAGVPAPAWAGAGAVTAVECHRYADDFGDQESFLCVFARGGARHAVLVLVDRTLGGMAKDAFVVDDVTAVLGELAEQAAAEAFTSLTPVAAEEARAALVRAFAVTDGVVLGDEHDAEDEDLAGLAEELSEDFPAARAFVVARTAALPGGAEVTGGDGAYEAYDPDAVTADFLGSPEAAALDDPAWAARLAHVWAESVAGLGDDPRRVSPGRIEDLLLDITPGGVLLDAAGQRAVPDVARAWVAWALRSGRRELSAEAVAYLGEALDEVLAEFPAGYLDLQAVLYRHANPDTADLRA